MYAEVNYRYTIVVFQYTAVASGCSNVYILLLCRLPAVQFLLGKTENKKSVGFSDWNGRFWVGLAVAKTDQNRKARRFVSVGFLFRCPLWYTENINTCVWKPRKTDRIRPFGKKTKNRPSRFRFLFFSVQNNTACGPILYLMHCTMYFEVYSIIFVWSV